MFTLPDAIALLAVTLPVAAAVWRYAPRRHRPVHPANADGGACAAPTESTALKEISDRVMKIEIEQSGFRAEVRGEFKMLKHLIQFLPSGQARPGSIGCGDSDFSRRADS
jgi:hypothetical protein